MPTDQSGRSVDDDRPSEVKLKQGLETVLFYRAQDWVPRRQPEQQRITAALREYRKMRSQQLDLGRVASWPRRREDGLWRGPSPHDT